MDRDDFLIVGAGSAGLFTGLAAVDRGFRVRILDRKPGPRTPSYAVPLHPRSLELLDPLGALGSLAPHAARVDRIILQSDRGQDVMLDFAHLESPFPYALTVGLDRLEQVLLRALANRGIRVEWGREVETVIRDGHGVQVHTIGPDRNRFTCNAHALVGADGGHSRVRALAGLHYRETAPAVAYLLLEGEAPAGSGTEIRIAHDARHVSSFWPLPLGRARWNLRRSSGLASRGGPAFTAVSTAAALDRALQDHASCGLPLPETVDWALLATFEHSLVEPPFAERVWMVGDAAHSSGPSAAHSMNLGFLEASERLDAHRVRGAKAVVDGDGLPDPASPFFRELAGVGPTYECGDTAPPGVSPILREVLDALPLGGPHLDALLAGIHIRRP